MRGVTPERVTKGSGMEPRSARLVDADLAEAALACPVYGESERSSQAVELAQVRTPSSSTAVQTFGPVRSPAKFSTLSGRPTGERPGPFGRLRAVDGAELYAGNAAAMWSSLAPWSRPVPGTAPGVAAVEIPAQRAGRVILRWPGAAGSRQPGALVRAVGLHGRVVVEDSFGDLVVQRGRPGRGVTVDRMPLMLRPPAARRHRGAARPWCLWPARRRWSRRNG